MSDSAQGRDLGNGWTAYPLIPEGYGDAELDHMRQTMRRGPDGKPDFARVTIGFLPVDVRRLRAALRPYFGWKSRWERFVDWWLVRA